MAEIIAFPAPDRAERADPRPADAAPDLPPPSEFGAQLLAAFAEVAKIYAQPRVLRTDALGREIER